MEPTGVFWISVNEKLPNLYESVLFYWKSENKSKISIGQLVPLDFYEKGKHRQGFKSLIIWESIYQIETEVKYWAHLPETPV